MLDPTGLLAWPARRTLVVADLHFEKGSAFAASGRFLPPYDTRETLDRLGLGLRRWRPARLIALGDSFHDRGGPARLTSSDRAMLHRLLAGLETIWVLGNHDPALPSDLPGSACMEWSEGPLLFRHQARRGRIRPGEISGHFHPKATMPTRVGPITRSCFVADGYRVILPAFGAYTGGLSVEEAPLLSLFPRGGRAFLLGEARLFSRPLAGSRNQAKSSA